MKYLHSIAGIPLGLLFIMSASVDGSVLPLPKDKIGDQPRRES